MAKDYKNAGQNAKPAPKAKAPCWVWLLAGLAIGLFVAALVHLDANRPVPVTAQRTPSRVTKSPEPKPAPRAPPAVTSPEASKTPRPRFEFYTILPEREVRVPEHELQPVPARKKAPTSHPRYVLQVGSFRQQAEADRLKARIALIGLQAEIQSVTINEDDTWHRVRLGPFGDVANLNDARKRLQAEGIESIVVRDRSNG